MTAKCTDSYTHVYSMHHIDGALRDNLGNLSRDEVRVTLMNYVRDLRLIREGLVGDAY